MPELSITGASTVLNGDFNPRIFQPAWFSAQKLISEQEADAAADLVVHPDIAAFKLPWLTLRVIQHQFIAATTKESHFPALRDLVISTFRLLVHTPIRQLGINLDRHYRFESEERWNSFGDTLAPKEIWHKVMRDPGLVKLTMLDKAPREVPAGTIQVEIQSSQVVKSGISFSINSHFECGNQRAQNASSMLEILQKSFDSSIESSVHLIKTLLETA